MDGRITVTVVSVHRSPIQKDIRSEFSTEITLRVRTKFLARITPRPTTTDEELGQWVTADVANANTAEVPTVTGALNTERLNWGCTFHWDKKAMHDNPPNDATGANYDKAMHTHWLFSPLGNGLSPISSSKRSAVTYRTFLRYPGQGGSGSVYKVGDSDRPESVSKVVQNESGSLVTSVTYYEYYDQADTGVTAAMHDKLKKVTDPTGRETQLTFNTNGWPTKIEQKEGSSWKTLRSITHFASGPQAQWNLPSNITDAGGNVTNFSYNSKHQITATWMTVNGYTEKTEYVYSNPPLSSTGTDGYLKEIRQADPDSPTSGSPSMIVVAEITGYDSLNRPNKFKDADGYEITKTFDKLSRVTQISYPDSTSETFSYTRNSTKLMDLQSHTDREGKTTNFTYNGNRQLVEVTDAAGGSTKYEWCSCGDLEWLMDPKQSAANSGFTNGIPNGDHTRWHRDALGRVTSKVFADGKTISYTYQPESGALATVSLPKDSGTTMTLKYYKDGNLQKVDYASSNTPDVTYWYSSYYNRISKRNDGSGDSYYGYHSINGSTDGAGQLRYINGPFSYDTQYYNYDDRGRVDNRYINSPSSYPNVKHDTTWNFDTMGRVSSMATGLGTFSYGYVEHSGNKETDLVDYINYPNGQQTRLDYLTTAQGRFLKEIINDKDTNTTNNNSLSEHTYTYTASGQIKTWRRDAGDLYLYDKTFSMTASGSYDNLYQLKKTTDSGGGTTTYDFNYDTGGNRYYRKVNSAVDSHGTNSRNQLTGFGMTYDDNGNLLQQIDPVDGKRFYYEWDSINRLKVIKVDNDGDGVFETDDTRTEYWYDGLSRRYKQTDQTWSGSSWGSATTTYYVWLGGEIGQKRVGGSTYTSIKSNYYSAGESRHTSVSNKTSYFYTRDHLGSVREVTNSSKSLQAAYDYSPFGVRSNAMPFADTWKAEFAYTGHFHHAPSGTHLAQFRGYDPRIGRWLNADPIENEYGVLGELLPEGPNLYGYVGSDPYNYRDPSGLVAAQIGGAIVGGGADMALQLVSNPEFVDAFLNDDWDRVKDLMKSCVDWADVGLSAGAGALGMGAMGSIGKARKAYKAFKELKAIKKRHHKYKSAHRRGNHKRRARREMYKAGGQAVGAGVLIGVKSVANCPVSSPSLPEKIEGLKESSEIYMDYRF